MIGTYRFKITQSKRTVEIVNPGSAEATLTKRLTLKSKQSDRVQQGIHQPCRPASISYDRYKLPSCQNNLNRPECN